MQFSETPIIDYRVAQTCNQMYLITYILLNAHRVFLLDFSVVICVFGPFPYAIRYSSNRSRTHWVKVKQILGDGCPATGTNFRLHLSIFWISGLQNEYLYDPAFASFFHIQPAKLFIYFRYANVYYANGVLYFAPK